MRFNAGLVREIRRRDSIRRADLAESIGVSDNYLYKIERGMRKPGAKLMRKISGVLGAPLERLSVQDGEGVTWISDGASVFVGMMKNLEQKSDALLNSEKYVSELERSVGHLRALIAFHIQYEDIRLNDLPLNGEQKQKLKMLAIAGARENELSFNEMLVALRVKRAELRKWLRRELQVYKCSFAEGGEIQASTTAEAALRLRCFDCRAFESNECAGYGNEKRPENIVELIARLEANGIHGNAALAKIITECYKTPITEHEISEIKYRDSRGLRIPEGLFYLDRPTRRKKTSR
jgi:transcriptional regulator with XRE-family HTH domain